MANLLIDNGADVSLETTNGTTALHVAANNGNKLNNSIKIFLIIKWRNFSTGNDKFARTLIKSGADVNAVDIHGVSPLQLAVFESNWSKTQRKIEFKLKLLSIYSDYKRMVDLLVANGANVNHIDNEGKSVLHWAAAKGKFLTIRILSEFSVSIQTQLEDFSSSF